MKTQVKGSVLPAPPSVSGGLQRWFYMGQKGEVSVDQAHRGYSMATDEDGYGSVNPLFWKRKAPHHNPHSATVPATLRRRHRVRASGVPDSRLSTPAAPLGFLATPTNGKFAAQRCYGYLSFESFIDAAHGQHRLSTRTLEQQHPYAWLSSSAPLLLSSSPPLLLAGICERFMLRERLCVCRDQHRQEDADGL